MKKLLTASLLTLFLYSNAGAHSFWVNVFDSFTHPPGHALVTLGFGHQVPLDDLLVGDFGTILPAKYEIIDPNGKRLALPMPDLKRVGPNPLGKNLTVENGELGIRKVQLTDTAPQGTYLVAVESKPMFITQYVNTEGKTKTAPKALDQIKDLKDVIFSVQYISYAKSGFSYKKQTAVEPLGHALEILPQVNISGIRAGDLVPVKVIFNGQPLSTIGTDIVFYGGPDKFELISYLVDGKAQFRLPTAGNWIFNVYTMRHVAKEPSMARLKGKVDSAFYSASYRLVVKP